MNTKSVDISEFPEDASREDFRHLAEISRSMKVGHSHTQRAGRN